MWFSFFQSDQTELKKKINFCVKKKKKSELNQLIGCIFDQSGPLYNARVRCVVEKTIIENKIQISGKKKMGGILLLFNFIFYCSQVHWVFDDIKIVWDIQ